MPPIETNAMILCLSLYALLILADLRRRRWTVALVEVASLVAVVVGLHEAVGFPTTRISFGGASPGLAIAIMLICVVAGIAANGVFYSNNQALSWRSTLKPIVISPIVLLPLLGSIQGSSRFQTLQLVSLACLAFQNGFFWKAILDKTSSKAAG
jgi:hypothetical protein